MVLYFIRHGESEANVLREFSNSGYKHPLTPAGVQQARALARRLAEGPVAGRKIARIYTSPVMRAMQTAEILAAALRVPVEVTEALREWSVGVL